LEHVTKGEKSNNLTKIIVRKIVLKNGGVSKEDMAFKLLSFGTYDVNVLNMREI